MNPRTHPARLVAGILLRIYRKVGAWYWGILTVVVAILIAGVAGFSDIRISGWHTITASAAKYWLLVIGILLTTMHLRPFVAHGITRRHYTAGAVIFAVVTAAAFAVIGVLGFGVERALYDAAGWLPGLDDPYPVNSLGDAATYLARVLPLYLAHLTAGWLIGTGFYRYGPWIGTALIFPAYAPAALTEYFIGTEWSGVPGSSPFPLGAGAALSLTATAVALLAVRFLLRDIPIRRPAG